MTSKKYPYMIYLALFAVLLAACSTGQSLEHQTEDQLGARQMNYAGYQQQPLNQLVLDHFDSVAEVTSIMNDEELIMAIKARQLDQFNEQKIAKDIEDFIKKSDDTVKPIVSSDLKIFIEIDRLKYDLADRNISKDEFDQLFKELKALTK
ncbi:YhcN/YlaJ family sporulation lipoprotein [Amphibacillus sediminis]|uniref:YhcN/YlaJ family sporulation lipoprotein n=1 Tax=Amphibacillus sediminis TaxID=360185 RepID=UPI00082E5A85|nr:YhcN/YlaJ family sporulation lipoprotein [Amphibacillus sediminis]